MGCEKHNIHALLMRIKQGDDGAYVSLFACMQKPFYKYATEVYNLSPEDAQEVVQDTFVRIWERINTYDEEKGEGRALAWMWQIFRHKVVDWLREKQPKEVKIGTETVKIINVSLEEILETIEYDRLISAQEEDNVEEYVLNKVDEAENAMRKKIALRVWEELPPELQRAFLYESGKQGGTRGRPGKRVYWEAIDTIRALAKKYLGLAEDF